jgi:hypothetical protein
VHVRSLFGLGADRFDHNAYRIERTQRDVRLEDVEFYHAIFQVVGRSTVLQNDQAVTLDVGDVALVDSTRPVTYVNDAYAQWLSLQLPRRSLMSHLGLEPLGGSVGRPGTRAGRLLFQLVLDEFEELTPTPASVYMQLAVYDLIGESLRHPIQSRSLFTQTNSLAVSAQLSRTALPIRTLALATWQPKRASPYAISRSSLRNEALPVAVSSTRFDWITPGAFFDAAQWRAHASLLTRSPTPAVLTIITISHKSFADGSVMRRRPMPETVSSEVKIIESLG